MNKTLYWDIATEVKFKKVEKKYKKSKSKIVRMWAASPKFDAQVEELNNMLQE
jgi:hypothetical protein